MRTGNANRVAYASRESANSSFVGLEPLDGNGIPSKAQAHVGVKSRSES